MEAFRSAVVNELVGRVVTFLLGKCQPEHDPADSVVPRLQRALLRARVVVEEAEARQIPNRAMLQQLTQLKRDVCRAAYALDAFRWRAVKLGRGPHATASGFRWQKSSSGCDDDAVLSALVTGLEGALSEMREFVVLLGGCPRVTRQPYSAYLFMETSMFGRQMEREEIVSFLLRPPAHGDLDVLSILGPHDVGKRTLVEHVCLDERVRERFTEIHRLRSDELDNHLALFDATAAAAKPSLTVVDMVRDDDADAEESWRRFRSAARQRQRARGGSKIIVISRREAHASLGKVPALRLRAPCRDEIWYFFRALAFGAANPDERPDLARLAMALCASVSGLFTLFAVANIVAAALHADLSARAWRRLFRVISETTVLRVGDVDYNYLCRPVKAAPGALCLFSNGRKLKGGQLPEVTMVDLLTGASAPPAGETQFDVLMWQSRIPPYGAYVATCDMEGAQRLLTLEKRSRKRKDQHENHQTRCV